jgi:hypothetical protein
VRGGYVCPTGLDTVARVSGQGPAYASRGGWLRSLSSALSALAAGARGVMKAAALAQLQMWWRVWSWREEK